MKDFYNILGVPREASAQLIKATYLALSKIYHPDIYKGDKKYAIKRMQEINEAFEILKDKKKKEKYDNEFYNQNSSEKNDFDEDDFKEEYDIYDKIILEKWKFAREYYPEIEKFFIDLSRINKKLGWQFKARCVEDKCFEICAQIYKELKINFIKKYFGTNQTLQEMALRAILNGNKNIAKEINKAVTVLGDKASDKIINTIISKYDTFFNPDETFSHKGFRVKRDRTKGVYTVVATRPFSRAYLGDTFNSVLEFKNFIDKKFN